MPSHVIFENVNFRKFHEIFKLVWVQTTKNHKFPSLARIALPCGAVVYVSNDLWGVSPKSNTPTVGNLTTSCGHKMMAFDNFGSKMLEISFVRLFWE